MAMAQQEVKERKLLVDLISAEGLKQVRWFGKRMNPCAIAWVHSTNESAERPYRSEATTAHQKGGRNPLWHQRVVFTLKETQLKCLPGDVGPVLSIAVMHVGTFTGPTRLGCVTIPIWELLEHLKTAAAAGVALPKVSIVKHLQRRSGRRQGVVKFAVTLWPRLQEEVTTEAGGTGEIIMHDMEAHSKVATPLYYPPVHFTWAPEPEQQKVVPRYPHMRLRLGSPSNTPLQAPVRYAGPVMRARPSGPALKPARRASGLMSSGSGAVAGFGSGLFVTGTKLDSAKVFDGSYSCKDFGSFNSGYGDSGSFSFDIHDGCGSNSISTPELNSFRWWI